MEWTLHGILVGTMGGRERERKREREVEGEVKECVVISEGRVCEIS